jgi:hypothetical protein
MKFSVDGLVADAAGSYHINTPHGGGESGGSTPLTWHTDRQSDNPWPNEHAAQRSRRPRSLLAQVM